LEAELRNEDEVYALVDKVKPDIIYHLAGTVYTHKVHEFYAGNVQSTKNLLEVSKNNNIIHNLILLFKFEN